MPQLQEQPPSTMMTVNIDQHNYKKTSHDCYNYNGYTEMDLAVSCKFNGDVTCRRSVKMSAILPGCSSLVVQCGGDNGLPLVFTILTLCTS